MYYNTKSDYLNYLDETCEEYNEGIKKYSAIKKLVKGINLPDKELEDEAVCFAGRSGNHKSFMDVLLKKYKELEAEKKEKERLMSASGLEYAKEMDKQYGTDIFVPLYENISDFHSVYYCKHYLDHSDPWDNDTTYVGYEYIKISLKNGLCIFDGDCCFGGNHAEKIVKDFVERIKKSQ